VNNLNNTGETTMDIFKTIGALLTGRKDEPAAPQPDKNVVIPAGTMCWIQPPFVRIHAPSDRDLLVTMPHDAVWHGDTPVEVNASKVWTVTVQEVKP
jgi:hypothetical protein